MASASDILFFQALSPVHVGTGASVDIIDLPLARERTTGHPLIPGSSLKGALRAFVAARAGTDAEDRLFGFRKRGGADTDRDTFAGALAASDARLLLLPIRASRGVFVLGTSALALRRLLRLMAETGAGTPEVRKTLEALVAEAAALTEKSPALVVPDSPLLPTQGKAAIDLEDIEVDLQPCRPLAEVGRFLSGRLLEPGEDGYIVPRLCVLPDDLFQHFAEYGTEVVARVALDRDTRTVKQGALWNEENLPAETVLVGLVHSFGDRRPEDRRRDDPPGALLDALWPEDQRPVHTFGGKETIGHGRVRLVRVPGRRE